MIDTLRMKFLQELQQMIDEEFSISSSYINNFFQEGKIQIARQLSVVLSGIYDKYQILYQNKKVEDLAWIYISFLRSSVLDNYPAYRIDFYDHRDCLAEVECDGEWEFDFVFSHYHKIKEEVFFRFKKQTRVKLYEADSLLIPLFEQFHELAKEYIPDVLHTCITEIPELKSLAKTEVKMGELFDQTITIWQRRTGE